MTVRGPATARQQHIADQLDLLAGLGALEWEWDYNEADRLAVWVIEIDRNWFDDDTDDTGADRLGTREAEELIQAECDARGIRWRPVPQPGGQEERDAVLRWMEQPGTEPEKTGSGAPPPARTRTHRPEPLIGGPLWFVSGSGRLPRRPDRDVSASRFQRFCGAPVSDASTGTYGLCPVITTGIGPTSADATCPSGLHVLLPFPPRARLVEPGVVRFLGDPPGGWRRWGVGGPFNRVQVEFGQVDFFARDPYQFIHLGNAVGAVLKAEIGGPPIVAAWPDTPTCFQVVYDGMAVRPFVFGAASGPQQNDPTSALQQRIKNQFGMDPTIGYVMDPRLPQR